MIQDYNNLVTSLGLLNTKEDAKVGVLAKKKEEEASDKAKNKAKNPADEIKKREELLLGIHQELQQKGNTTGVLNISVVHLHDFNHYFFQQKVVNLSKVKKDDCMEILSPLLEQHYA